MHLLTSKFPREKVSIVYRRRQVRRTMLQRERNEEHEGLSGHQWGNREWWVTPLASWGQHVQDRSCMTRGTWHCLGDLPRQDILCPYILCKEPAHAGSKLHNTWNIKPFGRSSVRTSCVLIPCARYQHVHDRRCITRGTCDCVEYPPSGPPVYLHPAECKRYAHKAKW